MAIAAATTLLGTIALVTLTASLWLWVAAARRCLRGVPLVPWRPRPVVPWAFLDWLLLAGIWILGSLATSAALRQLGWIPAAAAADELAPGQRSAVLAGNLLVSVAILAIGLPLIALRTGSKLRDFGLEFSSLLADLRLGLMGFAMLAPPVYVLQGLLVTVWKPSKHPLIEMFKESPDVWFFALLFVSAALVAPLLEELVFRVVIQGFLEKAFSFAVGLPELLVGRSAREPVFEAAPEAGEDTVPVSADPYAPPVDPETFRRRHQATIEQPELRGVLAWTPIALSSAIFSLLHYSHGPDWIPLLVLAAGMGYLYQRTHRLLPSLTVHALLNAVSLWALWLQVHVAKPPA